MKLNVGAIYEIIPNKLGYTHVWDISLNHTHVLHDSDQLVCLNDYRKMAGFYAAEFLTADGAKVLLAKGFISRVIRAVK